jgi:hypothetical protein
MPSFSKRSRSRLETCDERLQELLSEAIKQVDFSVLCGFRNEADQEAAYVEGASTKQWPDSKHNRSPSPAVDVAPYPVDWNDPARFARLFGYIERIAHEKGIKIRWGADWNQNWRTKDERLVDMPHIEIVEDS